MFLTKLISQVATWQTALANTLAVGVADEFKYQVPGYCEVNT